MSNEKEQQYQVNGLVARRSTVFLREGLHERLKIVAVKKRIKLKDMIDGILFNFVEKIEKKIE